MVVQYVWYSSNGRAKGEQQGPTVDAVSEQQGPMVDKVSVTVYISHNKEYLPWYFRTPGTLPMLPMWFTWWFDVLKFGVDSGSSLQGVCCLGAIIVRVLHEFEAAVFHFLKLAFGSFSTCFTALAGCHAMGCSTLRGWKHCDKKTRSRDQTQSFNDDRVEQTMRL